MKIEKLRIPLILILTLSLLVLSLPYPTNAQEGVSVKILMRESPGQYYSSNLYQTLISEIRDAGGVFDVYSSTDKEAYSNFTNYDLIIIPNPGQEFSEEELDALKNYVDNGGSLLVMGDVQYGGNTYGKPDWLNALLDYIGAGNKVHFWGTNERSGEIQDNVNNEARPWQVKVTSEYFNPHPLSIGIEKVVITSTALEIYDQSVLISTSPPTSYLNDVNDRLVSKGKIPWLAAVELGSGKVVVCGSSRMFSDRSLSGVGVSYIKYGDNLRLFFNILKWTTGFSPKLKPVIDIFIPILDVFALILGFLIGMYYWGNTRSVFLHITWGALILGLIAALQVIFFGVTIVGVALPQWGYVSSGIIGTGEAEFSVPAWAVAFMRYLLAGFFEITLGLIVFLVYQKYVKKG